MQDNHLTPKQANNTPPPATTASDNSNQQATQVMREQIDQIYEHAPPNQPATAKATEENPYERTHQENFDWRNYHSAWQQYYQQYYQRYYWQHLHAERQKMQLNSPAEAQTITGGENTATATETRVGQLKTAVLNQVKTQAGRFRKSNHFIPVISAVLVGALFMFLQYNTVLIAQVKAYVSPGAIGGDSLTIDLATSINVGPEPKLIIPKINVDVPVDYSVTTLNEGEIQRSLRDGATYYPLPGANAKPGEFGNTVLLGHSSNDIFNQGEYKFVFVLLDRLEIGDTYYLHYQSKRYIYRVTEKRVIDPSEVSVLQLGNAKPMATLITCTPPGTALKRLVVFAEQISPDPAGATTPAPTPPAPNNTGTLPGNEPTLLEQIWNFFF